MGADKFQLVWAPQARISVVDFGGGEYQTAPLTDENAAETWQVLQRDRGIKRASVSAMQLEGLQVFAV